jgi:HSP20 family protein
MAQQQQKEAARTAEPAKNVPIGQEGRANAPAEQAIEPSRQAIEPSRQQGLRGYAGPRAARALTPFSFMRRMMEDMDRMFGGIGLGGGLSPFVEDEELALIQGWSPPIEAFERDGTLVVRADLPGVDTKDVRVDLDENGLIVRGERRSEHEEKGEGFFRSERSYGSFERRIPLPRGVDRSSCEATFDNGVLQITLALPKSTSQSVPIRGSAPSQQIAATTQEQGKMPQNAPGSAARH